MSELPPEVAAASIRLRPVVQAAPMPEVFKAIIANDARRRELLNMRGAMTRIDWIELGVLTKDKKLNLRPSAEKALAWNVDKGNPKAR